MNHKNTKKSRQEETTTHTPQQYNKKPVNIDQGLDFLKVWRAKVSKNKRKHVENILNFKTSGSKFLTKHLLVPLWGRKNKCRIKNIPK